MPENQPKSLFSRRHRRAIILSLLLAALLYLTVVLATGYEQAWQAFSRLGPGGWLLILSCSFSTYLLRFWRWQYYLRRVGWQLPTRLHLAYYLAGFALTTTPGKAGETIRSVLLRPHDIPYPTTLACFFSERLLDVVVIALLSTLSIFAFSEHRGFVIAAFVITLSVIPFVHSPQLSNLLSHLQTRFDNERATHFLSHIIHLLHDARAFLAWRPLYLGLILGIVAWSLQGFAFYYILHMINFDLAMPVAMGIYAISLLAGAISMIPGGIGSTEAAMGLLLTAVGAEPQVAFIAPLISRVSTLWFAVVLGLSATSWLGSQRKLSEKL